MMRFGYVVIVAAGILTVASGLVLALAGVTVLRAVFLGVNAATMLTYGYDKYVSQAGGRRVPEAALHILAAVGGTPGAFVGQLLFRHKIRDRRFRLVFWAIVVVQVVVLLVYSRLCNG